jgi:hypothetical protein
MRRQAPEGDPTRARLARAGIVTFALWLMTGAVLFSFMGRLHPRYLEAFTPAVAAVLGVSVATLAGLAAKRRLPAFGLAAGTAASVLIGLSFARLSPGWSGFTVAAVVLTVLACAAFAWTHGRAAGTRWSVVAASLAVCATSAHLSAVGATNAGTVGFMPAGQLDSLTRFLTTHRQGARYEFAAPNVTIGASVVVRDAQPVFMLTSLQGRPVKSAAQLATAVRTDQVRYALLGKGHCAGAGNQGGTCAPVVRWARAHATDIGKQAGVRKGLLYRLSAGNPRLLKR